MMCEETARKTTENHRVIGFKQLDYGQSSLNLSGEELNVSIQIAHSKNFQ